MLLASGPEDGHQAFLMAGTVPGPVATPDLAVDDRWAERLLGHPVGGWHPWQTHEGEEGVELTTERSTATWSAAVLAAALPGRRMPANASLLSSR